MAIQRLMDAGDHAGDPEALYDPLVLPPPPPDRPLVFTNMVCTLDGKTLQAPRGSTAHGLGSATDHRLMRRLQAAACGIAIGAGTLRTGAVIYPPDRWHIAFTRSGRLPLGNRFFTDAPDRVIVVAPDGDACASPGAGRVVRAAAGEAGLRAALRALRREFGIERMLLEGGADLNAAFYEAGLVDEVFATLAPKVKGGAHLPTMVDGAGLPGDEVTQLELRSVYRCESEMYLRYRVRRSPR